MEDKSLPEIYNGCAHPQSVWFEEHWRPIFESLQKENAELMAEAVKLAAALEQQPDKLEYTGEIARNALTAWQAFLDEKGKI